MSNVYAENIEFFEPSHIRTRSQCVIDSMSPLTNEERVQLILAFQINDYAFDTRKHWYKCRNGHLYYVGECGTPMMQTKCPDCGESIGMRNDDGSIRDEEDIPMKLTIQNFVKKFIFLDDKKRSLRRKQETNLQKNWMKLRSKRRLQPPITE